MHRCKGSTCYLCMRKRLCGLRWLVTDVSTWDKKTRTTHRTRGKHPDKDRA